MDHANELYKIVSSYFTGNKFRIKCMTNILIGIMKASTTNLAIVAANMPGETKLQSKYRRMQRFFQQCTLNWDMIAKFIVEQISDKNKLILIVDRTNWKFGNANINLLVLSIAWYGLSIPVYWINLAKAGNSNTKQRMKIISRMIRLIGIKNIEAVLGDRELIGEDWLHWLDYYKIIFVIRIKNNSRIHHKKKSHNAVKCFRTLQRKSTRILHSSLWGLELNIVGYKNEHGNLCILATNGMPEKALELYSIRWQIESMFLCLKSKGFNLESTHMVSQTKVEVLFGLLAILTCWNCKIGFWRNKINPIKVTNHNRPAQNLFHYGMEVISAIMNNITTITFHH